MSAMFDPDTAIYPFPLKPTPLSTDEKAYYHEEIKRLLKKRNVVIVAHCYTDPETQQLAEEAGGCTSDSSEMARFGTKHPVSTLLVTGVRSMGETVRTLSPEETTLMPTLQAECSLDLGCLVEEFNVLCDAHPDCTVVVYASTPTTVKACADWVVTLSISVELIDHPDSLGKKIIWVPDEHLGRYVQKQTDGDTLCWQGVCIVHDKSKIQALTRLQEEYPDVAILVHPGSPQAIVDMADVVGFTSQLIAAAKALLRQRLIVATDRGILCKTQQVVPDKELLEVLTAGEGAICRSCVHCPWMVMNGLQSIAEALEQERSNHEVHVDKRLRERALVSLDRMLDSAAILRG